MGRLLLSRRRFVVRTAMSFGAIAVAGCDGLGRSPSFRGILDSAESLTMRGQRLLLSGQALAREYAAKDLSPLFRANGTSMPRDPEYQELLAGGFADWRLRVDGLVAQPASYSLEELRKLPARTQITRHDCVEGWSAIGGWTGVPLSLLLRAAGLKTEARYAVLHCADTLDGEPKKGGDERAGRYYESIDLVDAFHPQTILAYALNGQPLPVRKRCSAAPAGRAAAGLQTSQVSDANRNHRPTGSDWGRQGRFLGRPRLRMVRRHMRRDFG